VEIDIEQQRLGPRNSPENEDRDPAPLDINARDDENADPAVRDGCPPWGQPPADLPTEPLEPRCGPHLVLAYVGFDQLVTLAPAGCVTMGTPEQRKVFDPDAAAFDYVALQQLKWRI